MIFWGIQMTDETEQNWETYHEIALETSDAQTQESTIDQEVRNL